MGDRVMFARGRATMIDEIEKLKQENEELIRDKHLRAVGVDLDNLDDRSRWQDAQHYFYEVHAESNRLRHRVAKLEKEAEEIVGISLDCEGTATTPLGAFNDMLSAFQISVTDRAELALKFSEGAMADIVFKDWHNSLGQKARSGLSLHDLSRLVSMLVREEKTTDE